MITYVGDNVSPVADDFLGVNAVGSSWWHFVQCSQRFAIESGQRVMGMVCDQ